MKYPDFFNHVPRIQLVDPLSDFLGAFENGLVEFSYLDAVKLAGHSCPTIAGAYLLSYKALEALYPTGIASRGGVKVEMREDETEGVTGVMANVFTQITGATQNSGFKGIAGNYVRHGLLFYNAPIEGLVRFTRVDSGAFVELDYAPVVAPHPKQQALMQKIVMGNASELEKQDFRLMWQDRVSKILIEHFNDPNVIIRIQ